MTNNSLIWKWKNETLLDKCVSWDYTPFFYCYFAKSRNRTQSSDPFLGFSQEKSVLYFPVVSTLQTGFFPPLEGLTLVIMHDVFPFSASDLLHLVLHLSNGRDLLHNAIHLKWMLCSHMLYPAQLKHLWPSFRQLFHSPISLNSRTFVFNQDVCKSSRQSQHLNAVAFCKSNYKCSVSLLHMIYFLFIFHQNNCRSKNPHFSLSLSSVTWGSIMFCKMIDTSKYKSMKLNKPIWNKKQRINFLSVVLVHFMFCFGLS